LLFGIDTDIIGGHEDSFDYDFNYDDFNSFTKTQRHVLCISPPPISNRIAAQHAILLCSKFSDGKNGSLYLEEKEKYYKYIIISPELKEQCGYYLTNCFDITQLTMFTDLTGFCELNSSSWDINAHSRW